MCECRCDGKPVSKQNPNFQVGDVVEWCGTEGVVTEVMPPAYPYPIVCMFDGHRVCFVENGKHLPWHTKPSLILVSRPKRKVKKTMKLWTNIYHDTESLPFTYSSKEAADKRALTNRIACVELTGTYEVEE